MINNSPEFRIQMVNNLFLSESLLLFNTEFKTPPQKREYRNPNYTTRNPDQHVTVDSVVVIRPTTPSYGTPLCHDYSLIVVPPKSTRVRGVCPTDTTNTHHFCHHTRTHRSSQTLGIPRRETRRGNQCGYPVGTKRHVCLNRGTPHDTLHLKGRTCMCQTRGVEEPESG